MLYSKKNRNVAAKEKAKAAIQVLEDIIYIVFVACKANYLPSSISDNLLILYTSFKRRFEETIADPLINIQDKLKDFCMLLDDIVIRGDWL